MTSCLPPTLFELPRVQGGGGGGEEEGEKPEINRDCCECVCVMCARVNTQGEEAGGKEGQHNTQLNNNRVSTGTRKSSFTICEVCE